MSLTVSREKPVAVITGVTTGIGGAYSRHLAAQGWDLVLIDQNAGRLEEVAGGFTQEFGTQCRLLAFDLADPQVIGELEWEIDQLSRIDMLVNDAGYWIPGSYEETDPYAIEDMVRVHDIAPARLIRAVLPFMKKVNSGSIINVSSLAALINLPHNENYSATKAYLITLTESLHTTLFKTGIRMQVLLPGLPFGDLHKKKGKVEASGFMMPDEMVEYSLAMLEKGKVVCIPNKRSRFQLWWYRHMPRKRYYRIMHKTGERLRREWGV